MGILGGKNSDERIGNRKARSQEKNVPSHILNKRADKKLSIATEQFETVMGKRFLETKQEMLKRTLYTEGFKYMNDLELQYRNYENRLFSFSYNMDYRTTVDDPKGIEKDSFCFTVKTTGKLSISGAYWVDNGSRADDEEIEFYLRKLNHPLIIDRIVATDMGKVEVRHMPSSDSWTISCRTLIGASTWIIFPPVLNYVKITPEECIKMLEFFELVGKAITAKPPKR